MRLSLPRTALAAALDHVKRVAKPGGPHRLTETFILRATAGGTISITATDFDLEATVVAHAEVESEGSATVPADALVKLVSRLPAKATLSLERLDGPPRVQIKAGRSSTTLPSLDPALHSPFEAVIADTRFEITGKALATLLSNVAFAAPGDLSRGSELFGISLHHDAQADTLCAAATDTQALARSGTPAPAGAAGMPRVIIPVATATEIIAIGEAAGDTMVTVAVTPALIEVTAPGVSLKSKLIEGIYPPYERVIAHAQAGETTRLRVATDDLIQALSRAELLTNAKTGSGVRLDLTSDSLTVLVQGEGGAAVVDQIDADFSGTDDSFAVGAPMLRAILKALGSDVAEARITAEHRTVWTRPGDDARLLCLLMPRAAA